MSVKRLSSHFSFRVFNGVLVLQALLAGVAHGDLIFVDLIANRSLLNNENDVTASIDGVTARYLASDGVLFGGASSFGIDILSSDDDAPTMLDADGGIIEQIEVQAIGSGFTLKSVKVSGLSGADEGKLTVSGSNPDIIVFDSNGTIVAESTLEAGGNFKVIHSIGDGFSLDGFTVDVTASGAAIPEPGTFVLTFISLAAMLSYRYRVRRA